MFCALTNQNNCAIIILSIIEIYQLHCIHVKHTVIAIIGYAVMACMAYSSLVGSCHENKGILLAVYKDTMESEGVPRLLSLKPELIP